jgi:predicted ribosomally synthesized peptide with nif11-like leader
MGKERRVMSKTDAEKFVDLLHTDHALRKSVHDAAEKIADIAKAKGYKVTREELSAALKEHWLRGDGNDEGNIECSLKFSEVPRF